MIGFLRGFLINLQRGLGGIKDDPLNFARLQFQAKNGALRIVTEDTNARGVRGGLQLVGVGSFGVRVRVVGGGP